MRLSYFKRKLKIHAKTHEMVLTMMNDISYLEKDSSLNLNPFPRSSTSEYFGIFFPTLLLIFNIFTEYIMCCVAKYSFYLSIKIFQIFGNKQFSSLWTHRQLYMHYIAGMTTKEKYYAK